MQKKLTYAAKMDELQKVLADLQSTELDVDKALAMYERGRTLVKELETYLVSAENKIVQPDLNTQQGINKD